MSRDALVVGINIYQALPSLKAPAKDAEAIAEQLQTYGEFRVHRLPEVIQANKPHIGQKTKVTLRELETALINLFKPKGNTISQTALFYFSGHGMQREAGIREGYLALSDSQPDKGFYGLSLYWLRRLLQESPVRQRIVILDCCHSGELLNFLEADPGACSGTDRLFIAASREYETAFESLDSPYSVLTQALLTGLDPHRLESGIVTHHALTDHVNHALKGEPQQPLFESSGSEIILTRRLGESSFTANVIRSSDICPYRGLECFDEAHAEYFFGREDVTTLLTKKVDTEPFVAVVGASGIGKSSLVRAGLLAQLRQQQISYENGSSTTLHDRWRIKFLTPTEHPLKSLAAAFIDPEASDLERAEQLRRAEVILKDGGNGLAQLVQVSLPIDSSTTSRSPKQRPRMLLVIDQFEEVFTLSRGSQAERERQTFFNCLLGAIQATQTKTSDSPLHIVIVLRNDFVSKCSLYEGLARQIEQHQLVVKPLKYEQIKATITRPAQKVGLVCEPNLIYTMLLDITGAPGELPLLQYTLLELWKHRQVSPEGNIARLTLEAYQELGGIRGTLEKRATEAFYHLTKSEQIVAKRIFLTLTQLGEGTEDTRRRVMKSELVSPAYSIELIDRVLEKLVAAKLVVTSQESTKQRDKVDQRNIPHPSSLIPHPSSFPTSHSQEVIDVIHEALIRNWTLLREWLHQNREMLRRSRRIEQAAQEWDSTGRPLAGEYLLHGLRLRDAEDLLKSDSKELSVLAQHYIAVSHEECRRARRESRQLQIAVPSVLVATLMIMVGQYYSVMQSQAEQDQQLQMAISRERAAIAQSILQNPDSDPMAALLISRLAAENGTPTYEAQSSLRAALQNLRLQVELQGHTKAVHQLVFSPDRRYLATASADGTIRLWEIHPQTIYNVNLEPTKTLLWSTASGSPNGEGSCQELSCATTNAVAADNADIIAIAFSPDGQRLAAIAKESPVVKLWSVESGSVVRQLVGVAATTQVSFSPTGAWIVTAHANNTLAIWRSDTGQLVAQLPQSSHIQTIQFSPDGRLLLVAGAENTAHIWRLPTPSTQPLKVEKLTTLAHPTSLIQAMFSPGGRWIATACADGNVRLWNPSTGQLQQTFSLNSQPSPTAQAPQPIPSSPHPPISQLQFSPNDQTLAVLDRHQQIWLWDTSSGQLHRKWTVSEPAIAAPDSSQSITPGINLVKFSPNGRWIVTTSQQIDADHPHAAHLWDTQTGQQVGILSERSDVVEAVEFSPDGTYVVTANQNGTIRLWAAEPSGELPTLRLPDAPVKWTMFVQANPVQVEAETGEHENADPKPAPIAPVRSNQPISSQAANEAIAQMLTITSEGRLQQWQILTDSSPSFFAPHGPSTDPASVTTPSPSDPPTLWQRLLTLLGYPAIRPVLAETPPSSIPSNWLSEPSSALLPVQLPYSSTRHTVDSTGRTHLSSVTLSNDGRLIAVANSAGWVEIYQLQVDRSLQLVNQIRNGGTTTQISGDSAIVQQLAFSPDGRQVLAIVDDMTVRLWDVSSGQLIQVLRGHQANIQHAHFSPDGKWIVSASLDRTARIWDATSGQLIKTFFQSDSLSSANFSPDSQQIVTTSWDGMTRIFEISTGKQQRLLGRHHKAVLDAQFSPNGQFLVTASADGTARLWDVQTGTEQAELRPDRLATHPQPILHAFFSPDGQYIATLTEDGRVYLWAATWETLTKLAHDRSLRQLTPTECSQYLNLAAKECPVLRE